MPIAYSCPHCGKPFLVPDQYAGQSGPCAACGRPITIPPAPPLASQNFAAGSGVGAGSAIGAGVAIVAVIGLMVLVVCGGLAVALLLPAYQASIEAARRTQSMNNLRQIAIALHEYHDTYNTFPPAVVKDAKGNPLYSGRVLLLPFLGEKATFNAFDKTKAWDSPENQDLSRSTIQVFRDPSSKGPAGQTDYLFVTGSKTVFEAGKRGMRIADISDGTSNTMMVVEVRDSGINWAEPRDLDISRPMALPPGNHRGGNFAAMADGSVRFMNVKQVTPRMIRGFATRNGKEPLPHF